MPHPVPPDASLRAALQGVRGLLLDLDGVLILKGAAIPGAVEAIDGAGPAGVPVPGR